MSESIRVLGIETSCDETAAAGVEDGRHIASNVVATQVAVHAKYGGIFPELASRRHIEVIRPLVEEARKHPGGLAQHFLFVDNSLRFSSLEEKSLFFCVTSIPWIAMETMGRTPQQAIIVNGGDGIIARNLFS